MDRYNWAGNYKFNASSVHTPETIELLQQIVRDSTKLKVVGKRHSFNGIADTTTDHLSLERFDRILALDESRRTVTVGGGITYGQLCRELHQRGYALHNLASLPHISVAGACATATHGSGDQNGILATAVSALDLVTADGTLTSLTRDKDGERFQAAVVSLGALGPITSLTLDIQPTFAVQQYVYENLPFSELTDNFGLIMSSAYSVSLFTDWGSERINQVWRKCRATDPDAYESRGLFFGASPAACPIHPIAAIDPEPCTEQQGVPGPWQERLPHFRIDFTPSVGEELQSEYIVPRQHAAAALLAVRELGQQIFSLVQISEVRTIAADECWMSSCYRQDSVAIHFTWKPDWPAVRRLLPQIEARLAPFYARPHWGKLFTLDPAQLQALYPRLPDFRQVMQECDPWGKFHNDFLITNLLS